MLYHIGTALLMFVVFFIQNMAFTLTSRSRNSGSPETHRYAAWLSNGIWFIAQLTIFKFVWKPLLEGDLLTVMLYGLLYIVATSEGSVFMMRVMLGKVNASFLSKWFEETGKKKVGSR